MNSVYSSKIYNLFLKEERKKRNLKIEDLSHQINFSTGFISQLENHPDILNNDNISLLLNFYGYDIYYLKNFNEKLNQYMNTFVESLLYIDDAKVKESLNQIELFLNNYKNQELYHVYYLSHFIYNIYFFDYEKANYYLDFITSHEEYYSKKYQALLKIYLARYYLQIMDYNKALLLLSSPIFNEINDRNIIGFRFISLSTCCMHKRNIGNAIKYCDEAIGHFTSTNNYRRLLNTNISKANQSLKTKDYETYINFNNTVLQSAQSLNLEYETMTLLHNNAFAYMMQNNYEKALTYYSKININHMMESHFCSYIICLAETSYFDKASTLSSKWLKQAANPYYKILFEIYHNYSLTKNTLKLNKDLIRVYKHYSKSINRFEKEFLLVLISYHYKKLNMYKSAMEYLEKLRELDFCD